MGEKRWWSSIQGRKRLTYCIVEAFAQRLIELHYFSWLYDFKQTKEVTIVKTEYDGNLEGGDCEIYMPSIIADHEILVQESNETMHVLCHADDEDKTKYDEAKKKRLEAEKHAIELINDDNNKNKRRYEKMASAVKDSKKIDNNKQTSEQSKKTKKRKIQKNLKSSTRGIKASDEEREFIDKMTNEIRIDFRTQKQGSFESICRDLAMNMDTKHRKNQQQDTQRYTVNANTLYGPDGDEEECTDCSES